jgi:hypothetical protein
MRSGWTDFPATDGKNQIVTAMVSWLALHAALKLFCPGCIPLALSPLLFVSNQNARGGLISQRVKAAGHLDISRCKPSAVDGLRDIDKVVHD